MRDCLYTLWAVVNVENIRRGRNIVCASVTEAILLIYEALCRLSGKATEHRNCRPSDGPRQEQAHLFDDGQVFVVARAFLILSMAAQLQGVEHWGASFKGLHTGYDNMAG